MSADLKDAALRAVAERLKAGKQAHVKMHELVALAERFIELSQGRAVAGSAGKGAVYR